MVNVLTKKQKVQKHLNEQANRNKTQQKPATGRKWQSVLQQQASTPKPVEVDVNIRDEGARVLSDALKVNTKLTTLFLYDEKEHHEWV